jgi:hypothetical protein
MQQFFGKRRATRRALGGLNTPPLGRLGALVFRLNFSDKLYWASLRAPTRIAGCALSPRLDCHPLEKRCLRKIRCSPAPGPALPLSGFAENQTISFPLSTVIAGRPPKNSRPGVRTTAGSGCIRNPRTNWALRLHCCRAYPPSRNQNLKPFTPHRQADIEKEIPKNAPKSLTTPLIAGPARRAGRHPQVDPSCALRFALAERCSHSRASAMKAPADSGVTLRPSCWQ